MKLAICGLAALIVSAGCSGAGKTDADKPYSDSDFSWLARLDKWETRYGRSNSKVYAEYHKIYGTARDPRAFIEALRPIQDCRETLETEVEEPVHPRLGRAFELRLDACDVDRKAALAFATSQDYGTYSGELTTSDQMITRAYRTIEGGLLVNRPLPVRGGPSTDSRIEPRLSRAASKLAYKPVEVRCWSSQDWRPTLEEWSDYSDHSVDVSGFVSSPTHANIAPEHCKSLVRLLYRNWRPQDPDGLEAAADAVEIVAHETEHLLNEVASEGEIECYAVQDIRRLGRALGLSRPYAARLTSSYWKRIYPSMPKGYRAAECKKDGLYDRNPETSVFP